MNKYKKNAEEFKKLIEKSKETGEPVITASQEKKEYEGLRDYQIDMLKSIELMDSCTIISISKRRVKKGEEIIHMNYNGNRLIPRK